MFDWVVVDGVVGDMGDEGETAGGVGEPGRVGGGELVTRDIQYWRVEERLSKICCASGYTSSDQVSNRGYTIKSINVT